MGSTITVLVISIILTLAVVWTFQRRMIYLPFGRPGPAAAAGLPDAEEVEFSTGDGLRLGGWFVPARGRSTPFTIVVFNGNAGNRAFRAPFARAMAEAGVAVLLFDYRGYGGNPGRPSEAGLVADGHAARAYLAGRPDVDGRRIVYFGESLGTGVAVALALDHPPAALILRSPYTSLVDLGRWHYPFLPVGLLLSDRFPSIDRIARIESPLLVIAGERDGVVPVQQSVRLFEAAPEPKRLLVLPGTDHNDYAMLAGEALVTGVLEFLQTSERRLASSR